MTLMVWTSKMIDGKKMPRLWWWMGPLLGVLLVSCATVVPEKRKDFGTPVNLPFMRMEANECYFIDDFLPTPDLMVTGKSNGVYLRYYTYEAAIYKVWEKERIMLAFYSRDNRCWSLFEEYKER
jgi:hypothetical protein